MNMNLSQSVIQFMQEPEFYLKRLLRAERKFLKPGTKSKKSSLIGIRHSKTNQSILSSLYPKNFDRPTVLRRSNKTILEKGLAGLIIKEQVPFQSISGRDSSEKINNLLKILSLRSHPDFPESIFPIACREGLGKALIETIGITKGWAKTLLLKRTFDEWYFKSLFWTSANWIKFYYEYAQTPKSYYSNVHGLARGNDETVMYDYINKFSKKKRVVLIDLGIGTGRELEFLKEFKNIKEVVGLDYSDAMLKFCQKTWKNYPIRLRLIQDDFRTFANSKKAIASVKLPKIFTLFFGAINNTTEEDRMRFLAAVKKLMTEKDILLITFSKIPQTQIASYKHPWIKFKSRNEEMSFYDIRVYIQIMWFWGVAKEYFGTVPQFYYDKLTRNIIITITGAGSCFFSHRFTKEEIRKTVKKAGMKLNLLKEGKEMYFAAITN